MSGQSESDLRESYRRGTELLVEGRAREAVALLGAPADAGAPEAILALAKAHLELGEGAEAHARLGLLLATPPDDPGMHAYLQLLAAHALSAVGRPGEATRLLEEAARIDPRMEPVARDMRRRVERGRSVILKF
jgi:hypothetical protein